MTPSPSMGEGWGEGGSRQSAGALATPKAPCYHAGELTLPTKANPTPRRRPVDKPIVYTLTT